MSAKNNSVPGLLSTSGRVGLDGAGNWEWQPGLTRSASSRPGKWSRLFLVRCNPFGDSISVNSQGLCGFGKMLFVSGESLLNIELFEFAHGLGEQDLTIQHFFDQCFEACSHIPFSSSLRR